MQALHATAEAPAAAEAMTPVAAVAGEVVMAPARRSLASYVKRVRNVATAFRARTVGVSFRHSKPARVWSPVWPPMVKERDEGELQYEQVDESVEEAVGTCSCITRAEGAFRRST
jgi:hypothetical protein